MQRGDRIRNDLARLQGARCVIANEAGEGRRLDEAIIKQLTGQDTVAARFLYGEFFEYHPTFKIFLAANHKPIIRGTDHAIWRRIKLIPFNVTIPTAEQDRKLREKLLDEAPGILAWAVRGCLKWQKEGLHSPAEVQAAMDSYRTEMDIVGQFLDEGYIQGSAYKSWCEQMGEYPLSHKMFSTRLLERGFTHIKSGGKMVWQGIGIEIKGIPSPPVVVREGREDQKVSAQSSLIGGKIHI
jgi:putative DNA primase/helicase